MSQSAPHVVLLATGGTISSTSTPGGLEPTLSGTQLLETIPTTCLPVEVRDVGRLDSSAITFADLDALLDAVDDAFSDPTTTGIVITHGTDTLTDTAAIVDAFHKDPRPIILTGSMRPADAPHPDGPANLARALRLAGDRERHGVLISFHNRPIPARGAFKRHTCELYAFDTTTPELAARPQPLPRGRLSGLRVDIIPGYAGASRDFLDTALRAGADGIVVEGVGAGNVSPDVAEGIQAALDAGVPVVLSTRTPLGCVENVYGGAGGAATLAARGVILSGYLRSGQSRMYLAAALSTGAPPESLFDQPE